MQTVCLCMQVFELLMFTQIWTLIHIINWKYLIILAMGLISVFLLSSLIFSIMTFTLDNHDLFYWWINAGKSHIRHTPRVYMSVCEDRFYLYVFMQIIIVICLLYIFCIKRSEYCKEKMIKSQKRSVYPSHSCVTMNDKCVTRF